MHPMHEGSFFTYIVASRSHTLYIGVTGDLRKRIFQHKWKELDGFSSYVLSAHHFRNRATQSQSQQPEI